MTDNNPQKQYKWVTGQFLGRSYKRWGPGQPQPRPDSWTCGQIFTGKPNVIY